MYHLSSAKSYFSVLELKCHWRNVIIFCSSIDISKNRPINDVALVTYHGKNVFNFFFQNLDDT